jgi:hypothetical protein
MINIIILHPTLVCKFYDAEEWGSMAEILFTESNYWVINFPLKNVHLYKMTQMMLLTMRFLFRHTLQFEFIFTKHSSDKVNLCMMSITVYNTYVVLNIVIKLWTLFSNLRIITHEDIYTDLFIVCFILKKFYSSNFFYSLQENPIIL